MKELLTGCLNLKLISVLPARLLTFYAAILALKNDVESCCCVYVLVTPCSKHCIGMMIGHDDAMVTKIRRVAMLVLVALKLEEFLGTLHALRCDTEI